jgi:hypothetical protein
VWAAAYSPLARHGVDGTETLAAGLASLRARDAYLRSLDMPGVAHEELPESLACQAGHRLGSRFAVAFEVFPSTDDPRSRTARPGSVA